MNETTKRIISAFVIGALVILILVMDDYFFWIGAVSFLGVVALFGLLEFYKLSDRGIEGRPVRFIGIAFVVVLLLHFYAKFLSMQTRLPHALYPDFLRSFIHYMTLDGLMIGLIIVVFVFLTMLYQLIARPIDGTIFSISVTLFGVFYTTFPVLHAVFYLAFEGGTSILVLIVLTTVMTDAGAYFGGRWFGRHNAGLAVSPRKTYEGYAAGFVSAVLCVLATIYGFQYFQNPIAVGYIEGAVLGGVISLISVAGDLVESALKRDARMKDSASLIPGHGGMLDLADALFYTLPFGYYYFAIRALTGYASG